MLVNPDSPIRRAALEVEAHVAGGGWDQPPRLFALVSTAAILASQPELAEDLAGAHEYTPVEQELEDVANFEELLLGVGWPEAVDGCAAVIERLMIPAEVESEVPSDPEAAQAFVAEHPERREVRLVAAVLRDGSAHSAVRGRADDTELLEGPDLVPGLVELLRGTLA